MQVRASGPTTSRQTSAVSTDEISVSNGKVTKTDDPSILAEQVLRNLLDHSSLITISLCVQPILTHLDNHHKWIPVDFPKYIFGIVMNFIQHYSSYSIIGLLLDHIERHFQSNNEMNIKTAIMYVVHDCMVFSAKNGSAGATMFDGIQRLVKLLKKSFEIEQRSNHREEEQFRRAVIMSIEDFTEKFPDAQMIEVIQFIIGSLPTQSVGYERRGKESRFNGLAARSNDAINAKFQLLVLKTIENINLKNRARIANATQMDPSLSIHPTFPHRIFDPLLKMMCTPEIEVRLLVLQILQSYVDRRDYATKLRKIRIIRNISDLGIRIPSRLNSLSDVAFVKKFGRQFLDRLHECILMENNTKEIFYAIYCLMCLVTLEADDSDVSVDMIRFCLDIQSTVLPTERHSSPHPNHCCIHALIAAYYNIVSKFYSLTPFAQHVDQIIHQRENHARCHLPPSAFHSSSSRTSIPSVDCLFNEEKIVQALNECHYDTSKFRRVTPLAQESSMPEPTIAQTTSQISQDVTFGAVIDVFRQSNTSLEQNKRLIADSRTKPFQELKSQFAAKQREREEILSLKHLAERLGTPSPPATSMPKIDFPPSFIY